MMRFHRPLLTMFFAATMLTALASCGSENAQTQNKRAAKLGSTSPLSLQYCNVEYPYMYQNGAIPTVTPADCIPPGKGGIGTPVVPGSVNPIPGTVPVTIPYGSIPGQFPGQVQPNVYNPVPPAGAVTPIIAPVYPQQGPCTCQNEPFPGKPY